MLPPDGRMFPDAADLSPDKFVWSHVKRTGVTQRLLQKGENLAEKINEQLSEIRNHLILFVHSSIPLLSLIFAIVK